MHTMKSGALFRFLLHVQDSSIHGRGIGRSWVLDVVCPFSTLPPFYRWQAGIVCGKRRQRRLRAMHVAKESCAGRDLLAMLLLFWRKVVMLDRMALASGRAPASEVKRSPGAHLWPKSVPSRNTVLFLRHLRPAITCKNKSLCSACCPNLRPLARNFC